MKYDSWKIPNIAASGINADERLVADGLPPLLAAVLASRGMSDLEQAREFLCGGSAAQLHDPMLMRDMDRAVGRIRQAVAENELVAVYGDYDVDGISSSCLMADCLRSMGIDCRLYIPDRVEEGYGLNRSAIKHLRDSGVTLIVTVDCGVTAVDEVLYAGSLGVDMLITDHHECKQEIPDAVAVVNPKRPDCEYPYKSLAGVGVAFKLACALLGDGQLALKKYSELVAMGTVADVMPMTGENRFLIRCGLERMASFANPGLAALMREAGVDGKRLTAMTIGFSIAPRLNAAGRLGYSDVAAELLLCGSVPRCEQLAGELCRMNRDRQKIELDIWEQAMSMLEGEQPNAPIVLAGESWHQGVIGIAASRLAEAFSLPVVIICIDGDKGKGSCRSFGGFNLYNALTACEHELESFGGHALAAGLNIHRDRVDSFRSALAEYYLRHRPEHGPQLNVDVCIGDPSLLDMKNVAALERLEPCGSGNPRPVLCMMGAVLDGITPIGAGKHVKLRVRKFGCVFDCVFFSRSAESLGVRPGERVDIAFFPQINEFRGRTSVQLLLTDLRKTDEAELCRRVLTGERLVEREIIDLLPNRPDFVGMWRRLSAIDGELDEELETALEKLGCGASPELDCMCLSVFAELGLIDMCLRENRLIVSMNSGMKKVDLESSAKLRELRAAVAGMQTMRR